MLLTARIGSAAYASCRRDWARNGRELEAYGTPPTTLWPITEYPFVPDPERGTKVTGSALEPKATELAKEADLSLTLARRVLASMPRSLRAGRGDLRNDITEQFDLSSEDRRRSTQESLDTIRLLA